MNKNHNLINGVLILDKPAGLSSNEALQQIKKIFRAKKAGHIGTLDPLATGVLPICFGEATKFAYTTQEADKIYCVTASLGIKTTTGDTEGTIIKTSEVYITEDDIKNILPKFTGEIQQIPPMFSALKHRGRPLYHLARAGQEVQRDARSVHIKTLKLLCWQFPHVTLQVKCSKGTYIRTLVEDIGDALNCGAHVSKLRRINAGHYCETQAFSLQKIMQMHQDNFDLNKCLLPIESSLMHYPALFTEKKHGLSLQQGRLVKLLTNYTIGINRIYVANCFIGIGNILDNGTVIPKRMIANT